MIHRDGSPVPALLVSGLAVLAAGCVGAMPGPAGGEPDPAAGNPTATNNVPGPGGMTPAPGSGSACRGVMPGPAFIRRLTRAEYNNTVRDLLGDTTMQASSFAPEDKTRLLGFDNEAAALVVSPLLAEQYVSAAEIVAARAVEHLDTLMACDPVAAGDSCARSFFQTFARRAWRRPLAGSDLDDIMSVYAVGKAKGGAKNGVRVALIFLLQTPEFFYRIEVGTGPAVAPGVVRLGPWELASRLSYELWNSMPDDELLAAAESGKLATAADVAVQARRLLNDARAKEAVAHFHEQWLGLTNLDTLEKDVKVFPAYSPDLRSLFGTETRTFIDHVVWQDDGKFATLLTAPYTYLNAQLAKFYGATGPSGTAYEQVTIDSTRRAGLLTQASFLATQAKANQTSPVHRGKLVREQMLCTPPPPPPQAFDAPDLDPNLTTRERFIQHSADPGCASCHRLMDLIGLGFENYDGIGRWRSMESGKAIDASGEIVAADVAGTFNGAVDLGRRLAGSGQAQACFATQWFRFAYGRYETDDDACTMARLAVTVNAGTVKDLLVALTQTDAFLYRQTPTQGGAP